MHAPRPRSVGVATLLAWACLTVAGAQEPPPEPPAEPATEPAPVEPAPAEPAPAAAAAPRTSRLQGRAYLGRNDPVVGATVVVLPTPPAGRVHLSTTDEKGVFRVDGLSDGQYSVSVELDGFDPVRKDEITVRYPFRAVVELPMKASTAAAPVAPGDPPADASGASGVSVAGTVRDSGRDPSAEVRVRLVRATGEVDPRTMITAADGKFAFADVAPGAWIVQVQGVGKLPVRTRLDLVQDTGVEITLVRQPASHRPPPLELMPPEEPVPPPLLEAKK